MRAVRATKDGTAVTLAVEDVPRPFPKDGELLVKIRASFVQPSDIINSKGGFPITTFPRTLGRDFSGTVVEGPDEWEGKDVYSTSGPTFSFVADGAHAEYGILKADCVARKPENMSFAQAAAIGTPFTTAMLIFLRSRAHADEVVMVLGATGSVGSAVVQMARAKRCKVITVGRKGTDVISSEDPELQTVKAMTGGKGPDIVVDTVGDFALTKASFNVLAPYGRLVTITTPRQSSTELPIDILSLYRRQIEIIGCNSVPHPQSVMAGYLQDLASQFEDGTLKAPDESTMSLISIDRALAAYSGKVKKAVIIFDP